MRCLRSSGPRAIAGIALAVSIGPAQSLVNSTRPLVISSTSIQPRGVLQIESGYDTYLNGASLEDQDAQTEFYYSLFDSLRLGAGLNFYRYKGSTAGFGNAVVGAKLIPQRPSGHLPGFGLAYAATLPSSPHGTIRTSAQQGTLIISEALGAWNVSWNGSIVTTSCVYGGGCAIGGQMGVAGTWPATRKTTFAAEVFGQNVSAGAPPGTFTTLGLQYSLNDSVQLTGGIRLGLTPASPRYGFTVGVATGLRLPQ